MPPTKANGESFRYCNLEIDERPECMHDRFQRIQPGCPSFFVILGNFGKLTIDYRVSLRSPDELSAKRRRRSVSRKKRRRNVAADKKTNRGGEEPRETDL